MGHKKTQENKARNLVAKYAREFNKASTFVDRKKKTRKGHIKHKKTLYD